jgi:phosphoglycolate phosphatase-like HAD superfamily hydrolase
MIDLYRERTGMGLLSKTIPILIFDFDGTLADTLVLSVEVMNHLAAKLHYRRVVNLCRHLHF